ncbi:hypothetical protein FAIPA1_510027 [Frankia sp. AiPs1]
MPSVPGPIPPVPGFALRVQGFGGGIPDAHGSNRTNPPPLGKARPYDSRKTFRLRLHRRPTCR